MPGVAPPRADWSDVRVFWAVAELGSFGAAARALRLGLTTVTRSVERLEAKLNAKLLNRTRQGVTLTEAGALAYDQALSIERIVERLEDEVADSKRSAENVASKSVVGVTKDDVLILDQGRPSNFTQKELRDAVLSVKKAG